MIDVNAAGRPHWPLALCTMAAVLAVLLVAFSLTSYGPAEPVAALLSSSGGSAVVDEVPRSLYSNATEMLVGAMLIESFSSARANGPIGENVTGHGLIAGGEAICNCACYAADDFTFCRNTAKTTVGVATYAYDPQLRRWEARGLRLRRPRSRAHHMQTTPQAQTNCEGGRIDRLSTRVGLSTCRNVRAVKMTRQTTVGRSLPVYVPLVANSKAYYYRSSS